MFSLLGIVSSRFNGASLSCTPNIGNTKSIVKENLNFLLIQHNDLQDYRNEVFLKCA